MKQFDFNNYVKNLPDCLNKLKESNNYKILETVRQSLDGIFVDINDVLDSLDLEKATGKTLDLFGDSVGQSRGLATDTQYRLLIKSKIMMNFTTGDHTSIVRALCITFNCEPTEVYIKEGSQPCTVEIAMLPLSVLNRAGLTVKQVIGMVDRLLPVGVTLETFLFEGTFLFTDNDWVATETQGFAGYAEHYGKEVEGGYLGVVSGEEDEIILPID